MELRILGQLEVTADGRGVSLGGPKQRAVLGLLLLDANRPVPVDRLVDDLWGESPPPAAVPTLQGYVARIRRALQPDRPASAASTVLVRDAAGYRLQVEPESIDAVRFERLAGAGRAALAGGDALRAADLFDQALGLWTGPVLADLAYESALQRRASRLEALRRGVAEERLEAYLVLGRDREVVVEAERLIAAEPLRERPRRQLMVALYREGRQAEALRAYQELRTTMREELGLDPSPDLQALEGAILRGDPTLVRRQDAPAAQPPSSNLPHPVTSFVGRDADLAAVTRLLAAGRLVTLLGPGGIGKTRLAVEVASQVVDDHPDGVWFVDLAPLRDPGRVPQAVAAVLGVQDDQGRPLADSVAGYARHRRLLLVLDNCEHVVEASAAFVETLLRACPDVRVLVTTRERLGATGEVLWRVPSLSVPAPGGPAGLDELLEHDAVRLFVARACAVRPDLAFGPEDAPALAEVCRRLEGMPLAIELAAARVALLHVAQIAERLGDRFRLLTSGPRTVAPRHQTLRATVDWSYELLDQDERVLLARLSVFRAGFTLDAVERVCEDQPRDPSPGSTAGAPSMLDLLGSLVAKSLVVVEARRGAARYRLYETIREYAAEKLAETDRPEVLHRRHRDYYLALAEQSALPALDPLVADIDNVRAALQWSLDHGDGEAALRLVRGLAPYWITHGQLRDGVQLLRRAVELARTGSADGSCPGQVLLVLADMESMLGHYDTAGALYDEVRRLTDAPGAWRGLVSTLRKQGHHEEALEAAARGSKVLNGEGLGMMELERGRVLLVAGRFADAAAALKGALALVDPEGVLAAEALVHLARAQIGGGDLKTALAQAVRATTLFQLHGDVRGLLVARRVLGGVQESLDRLDDAAASLQEGLDLAERLDNVEEQGACLINLGLVEAKRGRWADAIGCDRRAVEQFERIGHESGRAIAYANLAEKLEASGEDGEALSCCDRALDIARRCGFPMTVAEASHTKALVLLRHDDPCTALELATASAEAFAGAGARSAAADALDVAAAALRHAGRVEQAAEVANRAERMRGDAAQTNC